MRGDDIADAGIERVPLPMTPIIFAMRAPVLSATSSLDRIWSIKLGRGLYASA